MRFRVGCLPKINHSSICSTAVLELLLFGTAGIAATENEATKVLFKKLAPAIVKVNIQVSTPSFRSQQRQKSPHT
jgi:hypothetical protein